MVKALLQGCVVTQFGRQCNGFGFAIALLYAWADDKTPDKSKIQPGSSILCEQGENIEWFRVK